MPKSFRELHLRAKLRGLVDLKPESLLQWVEIPVIADPTSTEYEDPFQQAFGNQCFRRSSLTQIFLTRSLMF